MKKYPKVFSGVFISMVHSGEESGGLPRTLSEIGVTLKKTYIIVIFIVKIVNKIYNNVNKNQF